MPYVIFAKQRRAKQTLSVRRILQFKLAKKPKAKAKVTAKVKAKVKAKMKAKVEAKVKIHGLTKPKVKAKVQAKVKAKRIRELDPTDSEPASKASL